MQDRTTGSNTTLQTARRIASRGGGLCFGIALAAACAGLQCPGQMMCATDAECDDGEFCNGAETCDMATMTCTDGTAPCAEGETCLEDEDACVGCVEDADCDDGDACTTDMCDAAMCVNTPVMCPEGETCVDGECVSDMPDPCEGVTCETCEECVDGVCMPLEGMVAAGETFYMDNGCAGCHGANGNDGFAPDVTDEDCTTHFDKLSGNVSHVGGEVDGVTEQDAADLAAYLASLGQ